MDLLAFRSKDDTRACASTCGRADGCPLLAAGNSADDRAYPGAACDDACVPPLLGIRRGCIGVRRDWDRPVTLDNIGERETDAGPAFHSARPFRIDNASTNLCSFLEKRRAIAGNGFRQVCPKEVTG